MWFNVSARQVIVPWPFLYACWDGVSKLWPSKYVVNWISADLSNIFDKADKMAIGR